MNRDKKIAITLVMLCICSFVQNWFGLISNLLGLLGMTVWGIKEVFKSNE